MEASQTLAARARGAARSAAGAAAGASKSAAGAARSMGALALVITVLGVAGGIVLVVAELSTVVTVDVLTSGTCEEIADPALRDACSVSGVERHGER